MERWQENRSRGLAGVNKLNFSGLRVLVTGGAGGIGAVICRRLHAMGAEVIVHYNNSKKHAEELSTELNCHAIQADLTDKKGVGSLFSSIDSLIGGVIAVSQMLENILVSPCRHGRSTTNG